MSKVLLIMASQKNELEARALFESVNALSANQRAFLLLTIPGSGLFPRQANEMEFFWDPGTGTSFFPQSSHHGHAMQSFAMFLDALQPDAVYAYLDPSFNYDLIEQLNARTPRPGLYGNISDYHPVCPRSDSMLNQDGKPCLAADLECCAACCPTFTPAALWQRKRRYWHYLKMLDGIAMSTSFMQDRYLASGFPPEKLLTLDSLPPLTSPGIRGKKRRSYKRYAYFGPVTPESGIQRVISGLVHLSPELRNGLTLTIYGNPLATQPENFQNEIKIYLNQLPHGTVLWKSPAKPDSLVDLLLSEDWIIAPELWGAGWRAPLAASRNLSLPIIAAAHAGHDQKISHEIDGVLIGENAQLKTWKDGFNYTSGNGRFWERLSRDAPLLSRQHLLDEHLAAFGLLENAWDF